MPSSSTSFTPSPHIAYADVYAFIADAVIAEAKSRGRAVYAVPEHPFVFEIPSSLIAERAKADDIALRVVPGVSFVENVYAALHIDPVDGMQIANAFDFRLDSPPFTTTIGLLIAQLFGRPAPDDPVDQKNVTFIDTWLRARFPPDHAVSLVSTMFGPACETSTKTFPLGEFIEPCGSQKGQATLYVPPLSA